MARFGKVFETRKGLFVHEYSTHAGKRGSKVRTWKVRLSKFSGRVR